MPGSTVLDSDSARERLIEDWQTIWRSELRALSTDREVDEALEAAVAWSETMALAGWPALDAGAPVSAARSDAAAGAAPVVAAPDARDAAILNLERRVADLEQRLAAAR